MSNQENEDYGDIALEQAIEYLGGCGYSVNPTEVDFKVTWIEDGRHYEEFLSGQDLIQLHEEETLPEATDDE